MLRQKNFLYLLPTIGLVALLVVLNQFESESSDQRDQHATRISQMIQQASQDGDSDASPVKTIPVVHQSQAHRDEVATEIDETGMIPTADAIAMMKGRIVANPSDYLSMTVLGQLYLRAAKENDDHQQYVKAEEVFQQAIDANERAKAAQVHLVSALHSQHKFAAALAQSKRAIEAIPGNLAALAGQGDALLELGRLDEANVVFESVFKTMQTPGVLARMARVAELKGDLDRAVDLIEQARKQSLAFGEQVETSGWYDFRLGMLHTGQGNWGQAESIYKEGLKRNSGDVRLINGLAELQFLQGNYEAAEKLYRQSLEIENAPPTMAKLGDVLEKAGRQEEAIACWDKTDVLMADEAETTGVAHLRERAVFLLNHDRHLPLALSLATEDLKHRKDIYSYDTLAWAQFKNGQLPEAFESSCLAVATGAGDAELWYRAGLIAMKAGENTDAIARLERCLAINSRLNEVKTESPGQLLEQLREVEAAD